MTGPERATDVEIARLRQDVAVAFAASQASGPVGAGRSLNRLTIPPAEEGVWAYQRSPVEGEPAFRFYRSTRDTASLDADDACRARAQPPRPPHDRRGLAALRLSGSEGLSSPAQMARIVEDMGTARTVTLDLRQESHAVAAGHAISLRGRRDWVNIGRTTEEVLAREAQQIDQLRQLDALTIVSFPDMKAGIEPPGTKTLPRPAIWSESELVAAGGGAYRRVGLTDHLRPNRVAVDEIIGIVREIESADTSTGLHVHCAGGRGRTTTVMIMVDMLHNAGVVSADAIIDRQAALGYGYNMRQNPDKPYKFDYVNDRLDFLQTFHAYARANPCGRPMTYSQWRMEAASPEPGPSDA